MATINLVGPDGEKIPYRQVVMHVQSRLPNGTPHQLLVIPDDTTIKLSEHPEDNEFIVAFVQADCVKDF